MLCHHPVVQKQNVIGNPACLSNIVGHKDDLCTLFSGISDHPFNRERRSGVKAGRGFIQK